MKLFAAVLGALTYSATAQHTFVKEVSDAAEPLKKKSKNRFGNLETEVKKDFEAGVFEKVVEFGGDNNHFYFDYE